ncbi:MAG TPA: cyclic nucleotide-binding domain-containing protein [Gammaproteobacteria bacterium]|mgnify:CR=1 FL=1|nr:cyclic nucleotide-binding domain-containing protein [Gammaproteobacteria bacterium]
MRRITPNNTRTTCKQCSIVCRCLGRNLSAADIEENLGISGCARVLHKQEHLFDMHQPFHSLYIIKSGAIKTFSTTHTGEQQVLGFHQPGEILGLDAVNSRYATTAVALTTTGVCALNKDEVTRAMRRSSAFLEQIMEHYRQELFQEKRMLTVLARKDADQRVATFLLSQIRGCDFFNHSQAELTLPMSRSDIGNYLGLAPETISRVLRRFQEAQLIVVQRNRVNKINSAGLYSMAGESVWLDECSCKQRQCAS